MSTKPAELRSRACRYGCDVKHPEICSVLRKMSVNPDILSTHQTKGQLMNMCEDFPCCGHEMNDCDGSLYGSDDAIKQDMWRMMSRMADAEMGDL